MSKKKTFKESVMKENTSSGSAGAKEFIITLKVEGGGGKKKDETEKLAEVAKDSGKILLETVKGQALDVADYYVNRTLSLNDDYIGQRNYARAKQLVGSVSGTISSAVSWGRTGASVGGAGGAIAGALIGLAIDGVNKAISNAEARDAQEISLRQQDAQLDFTRQRAGWSTEAASIGEDL